MFGVLCTVLLPHYRKDVAASRSVQMALSGVKSIYYRVRLDKLALFALKYQSLRGDLIDVNQIMS